MKSNSPPLLPANACDSHIHIFDTRFAEEPRYIEPFRGATATDYLHVQRKLGTHRVVIIQAKRYDTDNACLLDALAQLGDNARGIAVVSLDIDESTLRDLDSRGVRGLRFSVWNPADTVMTIDMLEGLARRIATLGWHVQLHMTGEQIVQNAALLRRLPCSMVFDHMIRLPPREAMRHPAWSVVQDLLQSGKCWIKLSGPYLNSVIGGPDYPEAAAVAAELARCAPERLVWGSDWPHVTELTAGRRIDTVHLLELFGQWVPSPELSKRILVENPARLYGFST